MDCHALAKMLPASVRQQICEQLCGLSKLPAEVYNTRIKSRVNSMWAAVDHWELEEETEFMQTSFVTQRHVVMFLKKTPAALRHLQEARIIVWFDTETWGPQVTRIEDVGADGRATVVISDRMEFELTPGEMKDLQVKLPYSTTMGRS
jgi:outer membrane lipoprotein-sorting protein